MEYLRKILLALLIVIAGGCGGGSEGTGTISGGRTLEGQILDVSDKPLTDASVTVLDTGDSTSTDSHGNFQIAAPESQTEITLEVESGALKNSVTLTNIDPDASSIRVALTADPQRNTITATNLQVWSRIVGDCDRYFENRAIIRQSNKIPNKHLSCTMRFFVSGDGDRLERVPGAMEVRACDQTNWRPIASGMTGFGINAGVGDIQFTFIDDRRNCEYRVVAPAGDADAKSQYIYLQTLTLQTYR